MVRRSEEIAGTRRSGFNETGGTAVQAQPFSTGDDYGYLSELGDTIEDILSMGQSVTIPNLGTFQTALTSPGFDRPEQVMPGKVKLSRVYFVADRGLTARLKEVQPFRIPFSLYVPESQLTPAMRRADKNQKTGEE